MKKNYDYPLLGTLKNCGIDLVAYIVERDFKNAMQYVGKDDLVGYGVLGLLTAARKYDPAKGVSFQTFACKKVRQEILSFIRRKHQKRYQYYEEIKDAEYMFSMTDTTYATCDDEDEGAFVRMAVSALPEPHREFVEKYFLKEVPLREMLKTMKSHRIFQVRRESLAFLRRWIGRI
ncbi:MAG: sigma-70 family RNA polymerase sigma factor [Candidatus Brocadia sp.]|nr:sigma-70 family RNA polymerase sigma factor [Candidatus Brocadia sp.]